MDARIKIKLDACGTGTVIIVREDGDEIDISSVVSGVNIQTKAGETTEILLKARPYAVDFDGFANILSDLFDEEKENEKPE